MLRSTSFFCQIFDQPEKSANISKIDKKYCILFLNHIPSLIWPLFFSFIVFNIYNFFRFFLSLRQSVTGLNNKRQCKKTTITLSMLLPADLLILLMQKKRDIAYHMQDIRRIFVFVFAEYLANIRIRRILKMDIRENTTV